MELITFYRTLHICMDEIAIAQVFWLLLKLIIRKREQNGTQLTTLEDAPGTQTLGLCTVLHVGRCLVDTGSSVHGLSADSGESRPDNARVRSRVWCEERRGR